MTIPSYLLRFAAALLIASVMLAANIAYAVSDPTTITNPHIFEEDVTFEEDATLNDATVSDDLTVSGDSALASTTVRGAFEEGGAVLTISTTSSTYTLTEAEMLQSNVIVFAPLSAQSAVTVTLPATSTIDSFVESAGEVRRWYILDGHTAVGTTTTFAAGTGIDFEMASSTNVGPDVTIRGGASAELIFIREPDSDIRVLFREYNEAD